MSKYLFQAFRQLQAEPFQAFQKLMGVVRVQDFIFSITCSLNVSQENLCHLKQEPLCEPYSIFSR